MGFPDWFTEMTDYAKMLLKPREPRHFVPSVAVGLRGHFAGIRENSLRAMVEPGLVNFVCVCGVVF